MENIQNPENKITTWWKKVLLILGVYIGWWLVFYGGIFLLPAKLEQVDSIFVTILFFVLIFLLPLIMAFFFAKKIIKNTNIKPWVMYITTFVVILVGFITFYFIAAIEALKNWSGFI